MKYLLVSLISLLVFGSAIGKDPEDIRDEDIRSAEKRQSFLTAITKECSEEAELDLSSAKKLLLGDLSIQSREAKCFVRCIFKKEGFLNDADEPQVHFIVESLVTSTNLKRKSLSKIIKKCTKDMVEEPCESAFNLLQCYLTNEAVVKNVDPHDERRKEREKKKKKDHTEL